MPNPGPGYRSNSDSKGSRHDSLPDGSSSARSNPRRARKHRRLDRNSGCDIHVFVFSLKLGMYRISGIIRYPARNRVYGWIWYPVSGKKRYPVLSNILYPVESHIRYYLVHYQLLPNTAATDLYGIYNFLLIKCTLNQSVTLNLPGKPYLALSGTIRNPVSCKICYPVLSGIRWNLISGYIRYPESGKKVYPVNP